MDASGERITLTFTMTAGDLWRGAQARERALGGHRRLRLVLLLVLMVAVLAFQLVRAGSTGTGQTVWALAAAVIVLAFALAVWVQRRAYRRTAAVIGTMRVTVDEDGVRLASEHSASTNTWAAYGRYVETPEVFVLLSPDAKATVFTVLPKSGLTGDDAAGRLRAVLDRHLPAAGR